MTVRCGSRGAAGLLVSLAIAGCGKEGAPLPPEPSGPFPPQRVTVRQVGAVAEIAATIPVARGEKPSQRPFRVEVVRVAYPPGGKPPQDREAFRLRGTVVAEAEGNAIVEHARVSLTDGSLSALEGGGTGWTLRYGVRVLDVRERPSILVVADDLVPIRPPDPPVSLRAEAVPEGVRVDWEAADDARCNVYRAVEGGPPAEEPLNTSPTSARTWLDGTAVLGTRYVYHVRTAGEAGLPRRESVSAVSAGVLAEDRFAPAPPTGLAAVQEGGAVRLFWNPSAERDLAGYRISRKDATGAWGIVGPDPVQEALYLDRDASVGQHLEYRIQAVDRSGNVGEPSSEVEIDVVADPAIPSPPAENP